MAGKTGWVKVGGTSYTLREWRLEMSAAEVDVSNFTSSGYAEWLAGLLSSRLTARGPLDANNQWTVTSTYTLNLGLGGNYYTTATAVLTRVSAGTAVDQAATVDLEFRVNGNFTSTFST